MLKKAGILVATAAAGLLAVSSVAFADEITNDDNLTTNCTYSATGTGTSTATSSSVLGVVVGAVTSVVANNVAQAPVGDCNNVDIEDVFDQDSNNTQG